MYVQSSVYSMQLNTCFADIATHNTSGEGSSPVRVCLSEGTSSDKHSPRHTFIGHGSRSTGVLWIVVVHNWLLSSIIHDERWSGLPGCCGVSGADPKSVLCAFYKAGQCMKGDKCKFSHDLTIGRKAEKRSIYEDHRDGGENGEQLTSSLPASTVQSFSGGVVVCCTCDHQVTGSKLTTTANSAYHPSWVS